MGSQTWIFGYGSLIWRPDFAFEERRAGYLSGWTRRFWQGSPDHRGTRTTPGRVVTLVAAPGERCWGTVFRLPFDEQQRVLERLDIREQGGYERLHCQIVCADQSLVEAVTYVAGPENPNYLGPAPLSAIAARVQSAAGMSGPNREYVLRLAEAIRGLEQSDPHVFALERLLGGDSL
jgi:glutathione-specific gamma-glutamylcyclotransferase